jgi:FkbM family methyltransferase
MNKRDVARALLRPVYWTLGYRQMYRMSRFLMNESRRDLPNGIEINGESMVQAVLMNSAGSSPLIGFDVGANVGDWTATLLKHAEQAHKQVRVHAFEPCDGTYEQFVSRARNSGWKNVTAVHKACSREPGKGVMNVYGSGYGTNSLVDSIETQASNKQEIALTSIDEYCSTEGLDHIDLLKIDAEGHDFEVIAGASGMLNKRSIGVLQFEYNQRWIGARRYLRDVFQLLGPLNYSIGKLTPDAVEFYPEWHWEMETYREGNYIACTEERAACFKRLDPVWLSTA